MNRKEALNLPFVIAPALCGNFRRRAFRFPKNRIKMEIVHASKAKIIPTFRVLNSIGSVVNTQVVIIN